jgi:hypothetical protein
MFCGVASDAIRLLAFETPSPAQSLGGGEIPAIPRPLYPYLQSFGLEDYCYTSSVLDGIVTMTPSWGKIGGMPVIRGLLLRHQSGAYETSCVGEVRLDSLDRPLRVEETIWLAFSETPMGGPSVTHVETCRPPQGDPRAALTWLEVPCRGRLDWWFNYRQCKIHHENGQASPPTCSIPTACLRGPIPPPSAP